MLDLSRVDPTTLAVHGKYIALMDSPAATLFQATTTILLDGNRHDATARACRQKLATDILQIAQGLPGYLGVYEGLWQLQEDGGTSQVPQP